MHTLTCATAHPKKDTKPLNKVHSLTCTDKAHVLAQKDEMRKPNITIRVEPETHQQIKEASAEASISIGEFARQAIEYKLNGDAHTSAHTEEIERNREEINWLKEQIEVSAKQLEVSASAHERDQIIMMELQAEKKAFYDENQKLRNQLSAPRIALPKFLSFLKTN